MSYVNQPIAPVGSRIYHGSVTTNIHMDRMATELQYRGGFICVIYVIMLSVRRQYSVE